MGKYLRKLFSADQVKEEFRRYPARQIGVDQASAMLKIRRRQFFNVPQPNDNIRVPATIDHYNLPRSG
jgi:hypothetical protein